MSGGPRETAAPVSNAAVMVVRFRMRRGEYQHLQQVAARDGVSLSESIREALYASYGVGDLVEPGPPAAAAE